VQLLKTIRLLLDTPLLLLLLSMIVVALLLLLLMICRQRRIRLRLLQGSPQLRLVVLPHHATR
jgi:hypothetical protein